MNKVTMSGIAGLANPLLLDLAKSIAERIPKNSILRKRFLESLAGMFQGVIETNTENLSAPTAVATDKAIDVWEFVTAFLRESKETETDPEKEIISSIAKRLQASENPQKEAERIKEELTQIKEIMQTVYPAKEETITPLQVINNKLRTIRDKLQERSTK